MCRRHSQGGTRRHGPQQENAWVSRLESLSPQLRRLPRSRILVECPPAPLEIIHVLEAPLRILPQAAGDDLPEVGRQLGGRDAAGGSLPGSPTEWTSVVSPWNARWPVTISYSTEPKLKMSERASTVLPSPAPATCRRPCRDVPSPVSAPPRSRVASSRQLAGSGLGQLRQAEVEHLHQPVARQP